MKNFLQFNIIFHLKAVIENIINMFCQIYKKSNFFVSHNFVPIFEGFFNVNICCISVLRFDYEKLC